MKNELRICKYILNDVFEEPIWSGEYYFHMWFKRVLKDGDELVNALLENKSTKYTTCVVHYKIKFID